MARGGGTGGALAAALHGVCCMPCVPCRANGMAKIEELLPLQLYPGTRCGGRRRNENDNAQTGGGVGVTGVVARQSARRSFGGLPLRACCAVMQRTASWYSPPHKTMLRHSAPVEKASLHVVRSARRSSACRAWLWRSVRRNGLGPVVYDKLTDSDRAVACGRDRPPPFGLYRCVWLRHAKRRRSGA